MNYSPIQIAVPLAVLPPVGVANISFDNSSTQSSDFSDIFLFEKDDYERELDKIINDTEKLSILIENKDAVVKDELNRLQEFIEDYNGETEKDASMSSSLKTLFQKYDWSFDKFNLLSKDKNQYNELDRIEENEKLDNPTVAKDSVSNWFKCWIHRGRRKIAVSWKNRKHNQDHPMTNLIYTNNSPFTPPNSTVTNTVQVKPYTEISPLFQDSSYRFNDNNTAESVISEPTPHNNSMVTYKILTPLVQICPNKSTLDLAGNSSNLLATPDIFKKKTNSTNLYSKSTPTIAGSMKEHIGRHINMAHNSIKSWTMKLFQELTSDKSISNEIERGRSRTRKWNMERRRNKE
ncbi:hypothetical protein Kpol_538p19 [Vanderwaltozyma polyspora DSM 70294]|uniref:Uncharacterized protein n=1 Tax=Vanderwaltozyma polyspora (strain ATCC 22028 / DSM 70294 / BCRC 21397 / CBS 2163 / NBRC 10782 / NRRL Y-8283 / UCD 57-17) TaxID=436907 RepID=A7TKD2_VANPO|nr:uncharacterized protein Kpol_538p19 [Vanderwaltozyma polyspora DSM 70294]EDO17259.1 hypothetical protein Kpol_538p19 [Vanderwaltozyma polyspora DSM 70294]